MKLKFSTWIVLLGMVMVVTGCSKTGDGDWGDGGGNGNGNGDGNYPIGAINGIFSVSDTEKVYFSQGNLQYKASTNTWRFAEHQWDYVGSQNPYQVNPHGDIYLVEPCGTVTGSDNCLISPTYSGWIDLFCWGTSGFNHGANCYQPWSTSTEDGDYCAYGVSTCNLYDHTGKADWGYNAISNGGNSLGQWHTPTIDEWTYVFDLRSTVSGIRYALARVNEVNGVILLPDDWNTDIYALNNTNQNDASFASNTISVSQWAILQRNGAVFLPAAGARGIRYGITISFYWSSTCENRSDGASFMAYHIGLYFDGLETGNGCGAFSNGEAVRLVCPAN